MRRALAFLAVVYIALLHLVVGLTVFKPDTVLHWRGVIAQANPLMAFYSQQMRQVTAQMARQAPAGALYVIGDSHVQIMLTSQVAPDAVNLGIGGDTTADVYARLKDYPGLATARGIVLLIGVNDIITERADLAADTMKDILASLTAPVWLAAIPPVEERLAPVTNAAIETLNARYRAICTGNCTFLDAPADLRTRDGQLAHHRGDGLHLNAEGYRLLTQAVTQAVAQSGATTAR